MKTPMLIAAIFLALCAAHAAPVEKPPEPLDVVHQLARLAAGKPLPVVVVADGTMAVPKPVPDTSGKDLLGALQQISAGFSDEPVPSGTPEFLKGDIGTYGTIYQPFAFETDGGSVWTVARDRTWTAAPPLTAAERNQMPDLELARIFLHSLSQTQLRKATGSGLRWTDYSEAQQDLLRARMAGPYAVYKNDWTTGPDGAPMQTQRYVAASETPLPIEKCVLHLYLGFESLSASTGADSDDPVQFYRLQPERPILRLPTRWGIASSRTNVEFNRTLKPSDLRYDLAALKKPLGLRGVTTVAKIVTAAAGVSGLPLRVDARWGELASFAGDAGMSAADALKLVTFALDGAWRRVGGVYLLTTDRTSAAAAVLRTASDRQEAEDRMYHRARQMEQALGVPNWTALADATLGPDPAFPLAPTRAQLSALVAPPPEGSDFGVYRERSEKIFHFSRLDPDQQSLLREAFAGRRTRPDSKTPGAPFPLSALDAASLAGVQLLVVLDVPGIGRVDAGRVLYSFLYTIDQFRVLERFGEDREAAKRATTEPALRRRPLAIRHPVRAVAAPPLAAGEWTRLLDAMRGKGLNTVYVPVLWDGMTPFPSAHFPVLPAYDGRDMLADVLEQAQQRGVRVVAVVHALAWRLPGSAAHWLEKHPDLVDVDAAGRTRRAWWTSVPPEDVSPQGTRGHLRAIADPFLGADFVRPNAPEVRTRLLGLLSELRGYKGLSGVALDHWTRFTAAPGRPPWDVEGAMPSLGYTLPERAAFLTARGVDPVDIAWDDWNEALPTGPFADEWNAFRYTEDAALATALLANMEQGWPGHAEVFSTFTPSETMPMPTADVTILPQPVDGVHGARYRRVTLPSAPDAPDPDSAAPPPTPDEARKERLDAFELALRQAAPSATASGIFHAGGVVLDFSAAPDLMWEALKLLP